MVFISEWDYDFCFSLFSDMFFNKMVVCDILCCFIYWIVNDDVSIYI